MADSKKKPEKKDEKAEAEEKPKGGGKMLGLLALVIGLANLGGIGFVGFKVMTMPAPNAEPVVIEKVVEKKESGPIAELEPFVVNLDEPGPSRYLKMSVSLEMHADDSMPKLEVGKTRVRDAFLRYLSSLSVADTKGEDGKNNIREQLLARARTEIGETEIRNIFFGTFVVQ